jgi:hypothetical protein
MPELDLRRRRSAVEHLQRLSDQLAQASTWLDDFEDDQGAVKACLLLEEAWKSVAAAAWSLERAARTRPAGWLAADGQQRAPGG